MAGCGGRNMYSEGAINSMVLERTSGLRVTSPYVFVAGSNWKSSGTARRKKHRITKSIICWELFSITFVDSITQIALPHLAVHEVNEGIYVSAAQPATHNVDALNNREALWEEFQVKVFYIKLFSIKFLHWHHGRDVSQCPEADVTSGAESCSRESWSAYSA